MSGATQWSMNVQYFYCSLLAVSLSLTRDILSHQVG